MGKAVIQGTDMPNHRLAFYKQLHLVESLEMPYSVHSKEDQESIAAAKQAAIGELMHWRPDVAELYSKADADHVAIKMERPGGRYLNHALALSVRPIIQNIVAFQLTGQDLYARQATRHLNEIMQKLADQGWNSLYGFLTFMIEDLKNGAAVRE
jgi:hypothetical protein